MVRPRPAAGLQIALLGELELHRDGELVPLPPSKKSRALLGYLCATGRPALRERLCALLWDGPDDPRAALRWSLTKLRPLLDDSHVHRLHADREHVSFEAADAGIDLREMRAALGPHPAEAPLPALRAAVDHFRGSFLEGLELPGCHLFHAWWAGQREELHRLHLGLRAALVARLGDDPAGALSHARALLALDPLAESSHVTVMGLLGAMGRTHEALEQYERCRQILDAEMGAHPSADLERLRMKLARGGASSATNTAPAGGKTAPAETTTAFSPPPPSPSPWSPPPSSRSPSPAPSPAALPLVGRRPERAALEAALGATAAGGGAELVVVVGDPGVGKTRLLDELRRL